jgi:ATP-binding cassette, subfamily B, bacterial
VHNFSSITILKSRSTYWQLLPFIRPQIATIGAALFCTIGFTIFWPILAQLAGEMANNIGKGEVEKIVSLAGIAAIVFVLRGAVQYGQDALMAKAALKIALDLRTIVYARLQKLSLAYFETAKTGDLSYRLTEDIDRIGEVINKVFHQFVPCVLQLIVVLSYMIYLNWQLTVASAIVAPLMAILIGFFGDRLLYFSRRSQAKTSNLAALLTEVFSGIRLIRAFGAENYELVKFNREAEENRQTKYLAEKTKALQFVVVGFLEAMSIIFLFFLGAWQIREKTLTGGEFVSYVAAVALLIDPISITTSNYNEFKQTEASVDRIFELLALEPNITEKQDAILLPKIDGKVDFKAVYFAYNNETNILNNIDFSVVAGETIALVGASGAGKSTLINLLLRFYDCDRGSISIDDYNIQDISLASLRRQIAIVPQENILFSGSIAQNIAFGQTELDLPKIEKAAKIANADRFITQFPQGYYTYVGERGVNLSGGQKQRIAIARAIYLNPRILILDEATSALDSESEELVREALERIMDDRTVFIIAHRLATVRRADRILVLENGTIVETGTHTQLLAKNGRYALFYERQFRE